MRTTWLFPNKYKRIGWILLIPATVIGIVLIAADFQGFSINARVPALFNSEILSNTSFFSVIKTDITNTLVGILFIIGAVLVGFSREKSEDEFIASLRYSSLMWAVVLNYALLIFFFVFVWGSSFLYVMIYNMFTILIIFIVRFNYLLYRNSQKPADEK